jgi:hypothetical protein
MLPLLIKLGDCRSVVSALAAVDRAEIIQLSRFA